MATGAAVVADPNIVTAIQFQNRKVIGIDMECYGVMVAAEAADSPRPDCIVVKGVSDNGDDAKGDDAQPFAAFASTMWFVKFVQAYFKRNDADTP